MKTEADMVNWAFNEILKTEPRMDAPRAVVTQSRTGSTTQYEIQGDLQAVFAEIETILYEHPAAGYGTTVRLIALKDFGPMYRALVTRANSCD